MRSRKATAAIGAMLPPDRRLALLAAEHRREEREGRHPRKIAQRRRAASGLVRAEGGGTLRTMHASPVTEIARAYAAWYETSYIDYLVDEELMNRSDAMRDWSNPVSLTPISEADLDAIERKHGPLPAPYVAFLRGLGAGHILAAGEEEPHVFDVPGPAQAIELVSEHARQLSELPAEDDNDAYRAYVAAQLPRYGDDLLMLATDESIAIMLAYRGELAGQVAILRRESYRHGDQATGKRIAFDELWRRFFASARKMKPMGSDRRWP